jgi:hypothetical protein
MAELAPLKTRSAVFLRMAAHAYHHVGQIIYLSQEVSRPGGNRRIGLAKTEAHAHRHPARDSEHGSHGG